MRFRLPTLLLLAALAVPGPAAPAGAPLFHLTGRWPVAGTEGWDALTADGGARRLYITHGTKVDVLDLDHGTLLASIDSTQGSHQVALAGDLGRGYVSCGRDSSVVIFDLATAKVLQRVALPARGPDAILYEPVTKRVLVFNGGSSNTVVLEGATGAIAGAIALGGRPEFAVADGAGKVFANLEDKSEIVQLDPRGLKVVARWPLAPGEGPTGLALDRAHHRLFAACSNRTLVVLDAVKGSVVATLPIGDRVDGIVFDPKRGLACSANGEGTITVVREVTPKKFEVAETDSTQLGARTITLDETRGTVYTVTASFGPPPEPTPDRPHPRGPILPGTFQVLVLEPPAR